MKQYKSRRNQPHCADAGWAQPVSCPSPVGLQGWAFQSSVREHCHSSLRVEYTSSAITRGPLKGGLMVAGKGTSPSSPTRKCQIIAWHPGGLLVLQRWLSLLPRNQYSSYSCNVFHSYKSDNECFSSCLRQTEIPQCQPWPERDV